MKRYPLVCAGILLLSLTMFAQNNPLPLISLPLVPINTAPGSAGFTLTVNGTNFNSSSVVNWNGSPRPTTFVSATQLTAVINSSDVAVASSGNVTVVNPAPGGGSSNVVQFGVTTPVSGFQYVATNFNFNVVQPNLAIDINNDGNLDVVGIVQDGSSNQLRVQLGNGDGTFAGAAITTTIGIDPFAIAAGDFNKDGKYDVAIANLNATVSVLMGNGDGTFQERIDYPTKSHASSVAVGDFNGDGNADLAVANNTPSGGVSVLLGLGNGLFAPQVSYPAGPSPYSVAVGDFNADGKLDIAASSVGYTAVLLGDGNGGFQRTRLYSVSGAKGYSLLVADFNQDGILDLATEVLAGVSLQLGKGDGTLGAPHDYKTAGESFSMAAGDFNEDGVLDIATARNSTDFYILAGNGSGKFQNYFTAFATGSASVSTGDFNNDGYPDISYGGGVSIQTVAKYVPGTLSFPNTPVGQSSSPLTVTFTNYGSVALPVSSISITDSTGSYTQSNTCGSSVPPNGSCTVSVVFTPTQTGLIQGSLVLTDGAYGSPQNIPLAGSGTAAKVPTVTLSPTSLTFGSQKINTTSSPQNVSLTNTGKATLTITSIVASGDFAQFNTCGTTIAVGQTCTIVVTFTPTATGTRSGAITLTDNAPDSPQTVPLTGTGTN